MYWLLLVIAGWIGFGALSTVGSVGKPRLPVSGGVAAFSVLISAAEIVVLVAAALRVSHA